MQFRAKWVGWGYPWVGKKYIGRSNDKENRTKFNAPDVLGEGGICLQYITY